MIDDGFSELLEHARAGQPEARDELARLMTFEAHAVARRRLGPKLRRRLESMDVTQSVVWNAFVKIEDFRGQSRKELRAWLARHVVSRIRDHADFHGALKRDVAREKAVGTCSGAVRPQADPRGQPTPSVIAVTRERIEQLRAAMGQLPAEDRQILTARQRGTSWAELAHEFGMGSADAARMRCVRIQNRLAGRLREED